MQYLRDNDGTLEASADGTNWEVVALGEGGGGVSDHTLLTNIGTNTHAQIDTHIQDLDIHGESVANPVNLGTLQLRDNAGVLEVSADNGATWEAVGSGGGSPTQAIILPQSSPYTLNISECVSGNLVFTNIEQVILPSTLSLLQPTDAAIIKIYSGRYNDPALVQITPSSTDEVIRLLGVVGSDGGSIVLSQGSSCLLYGWDYNWWVIEVSGTCEFAT